ncbi:putative dipeptidyl-aminopeptidase B [Lepidopterella palustris CBS 459.81]|uniref:dipeptidyl-peptidase IV n=1 Tax=Lepidopterella palustris CBS 459.81 TaxID=1314670 RepID=A0A8E2EAN0_9PEZI|nr:putative dipeptidyl-aminopeptidase B [Lepidopterella palustris CBS 459.81]
MAREHAMNDEETQPLTKEEIPSTSAQHDRAESISSVSTTSLVLEHINEDAANSRLLEKYRDDHTPKLRRDEEFDIEDGKFQGVKPADKKARRLLWILGIICAVGWGLALVTFVTQGGYQHASTMPHDPLATYSRGSGKKVTMDQIQAGMWIARRQGVSWIAGPQGEDGLLLERGVSGKDYLVVEGITDRDSFSSKSKKTLMKSQSFFADSKFIYPNEVWPSPNFQKVLVMSEKEKNWRHSFVGLYWIFDVATQTGQPLDPANPEVKVQLASWSPRSDAIIFTRDNNMFLRRLDSDVILQITKDGGSELFNGVPDWVYEEEVFAGNSATWWSDDAEYIAFLRTDESAVPTFPVQYFLSRPSGKKPKPGEENYPEVRDIKYPKAGAPNPTVTLQIYDVAKNEVFAVKIDDDFVDADRLITEVVWAGHSKQVIVRETNRESDLLKVVLIDVERRTGKAIRTVDVNAVDGGWFEVSEKTTFIPSDPANGRNHDGYIDTVIHEGYDHLAYFTPLDNPNPVLLTSGKWEVVDAPSVVDLTNNLVYFIATKESSIQRHAYCVKLDGTDLKAITDTTKEGYYDVSFSKLGGYALVTYNGPGIPWQKLISTPSTKQQFEKVLEENKALDKLAREHELPVLMYQTVNVNGFELNVLERRPPHFDPKKKYPVLFFLYNGPGSQQVEKKFHVDFQSFVASNLGYIVVTVDGRGTGFLGRDVRCVIRGNIGHYEAHDQIATAKIWAQKNYIDEDRIAIWGWSYGGFMTLKTLEIDAGETFKYGMAVAPVTDWRFYDSVYTERYMHTPQHNPEGYDNSSISDVNALAKNVRFLVMHGVADDNVHMQNSLTLLDKLDLAGIENYDVHVFPDSDHSIYFHNANKIVYDKLTSWLINAFNGEWLKIDHAVPKNEAERKVRA